MKINCEIITPLLMHGSDGKTPELREQSIKGVMRFWWRAIHGNLSLEELRKQEAKIFGDTSNKSSFRMKIRNKNLIVENNKTFYEGLQKEGIKYNFYSLIINKEASFIENGCFELDLYFKDDDTKKEIIKVLNYINFFGNFGARSRRGAGSIKFNNNELLEFGSNTKEDLKSFISKEFNKVSGKIFTIFAKDIFIFDPKNSWQEALESIASPFKNFRNEVKGQVFKTPNFGFPIRHRNKNIFLGNKKINYKCKYIERRASPLLFKVFKSKDNVYFPILIWMNGDFLPQNYKIGIKWKCDENKMMEPDDSIIQSFINSKFNEGQDYVKW
jgi:CRISPR-associated protein Cmr1